MIHNGEGSHKCVILAAIRSWFFVRIWAQSLSTRLGWEKDSLARESEISSIPGLYPLGEDFISIFVFFQHLKTLLREKVNYLLQNRVKYIRFVSFMPVHKPSDLKMDFLSTECPLI